MSASKFWTVKQDRATYTNISNLYGRYLWAIKHVLKFPIQNFIRNLSNPIQYTRIRHILTGKLVIIFCSKAKFATLQELVLYTLSSLNCLYFLILLMTLSWGFLISYSESIFIQERLISFIYSYEVVFHSRDDKWSVMIIS